MDISEKAQEFLTTFEHAFQENSLTKLSLGNYKGKEEQLKNIYIKKVLIKKE